MSEIIKKCTDYRSKPNVKTFPELPTVTTWLRFIIGGVYGLSLGLRNETKGLIGSLFGLNVITFLPMFWFNAWLDANVESYKKLNFIGVINAFAFMMLIWITLFTLEHGDDEASLTKVITKAMKSTVTGESGDLSGADTAGSAGGNDEF